MSENKFHCPVIGCSFVGTTFEINEHLQVVEDEDHRIKEHQLEEAMNSAYDEAELYWVQDNCEEVK